MRRDADGSLYASKAYERFATIILRSHHLVSLHETLEANVNPSDPSLDFSDLLRAAIVIAVAGMDAYFTDVFAERLVPFLKKKRATDSLTELLEKAGMDVAMALELLSMQRPFRRIRALVEAHLQRHVTQRSKAIDELFAVYGILNICKNAEKKLKRKTLLREIELLVQRRHAIVHDGDINGHNTLTDLSETWVRNRVFDVQKFVAATDEILRNQLL